MEHEQFDEALMQCIHTIKQLNKDIVVTDNFRDLTRQTK